MRVAIQGFLLTLLLLAPVTGAQEAPGGLAHPEFFGFEFLLESDAYREIPFLGSGYFNFTVVDLSRDTTNTPEVPLNPIDVSPNSHVTQLTATLEGLNGEAVRGWNLIGNGATIFTQGGGRGGANIRLDAAPGSFPNFVRVTVNATFFDPVSGTTLYGEHVVNARLAPYWNGYAEVLEVSTKAGQDEIVHIPVRIENRATYLDTYLINVSGPSDFLITAPARVTIAPESSEVINVTLRTPKGKPIELLRIEQLTIEARSIHEPAVAYPATAIVQIRGTYVAKQWIPMGLLVGLCAVLLARRRNENADLRAEEHGGPRRPRLKPRQEVMLHHLKRTDKDAYKEKRAALHAVYAERRQTYREHRKEEAQREKAALKAARLRAVEERKQRKLDAKEQRKQRKVQKKEDQKKGKEEKKRLKVLKKERGKLEKKLAKAKAKKEKADAKEAKKRAKQEAREAKAKARAEKKAQRAQGKK